MMEGFQIVMTRQDKFDIRHKRFQLIFSTFGCLFQTGIFKIVKRKQLNV